MRGRGGGVAVWDFKAGSGCAVRGWGCRPSIAIVAPFSGCDSGGGGSWPGGVVAEVVLVLVGVGAGARNPGSGFCLQLKRLISWPCGISAIKSSSESAQSAEA